MAHLRIEIPDEVQQVLRLPPEEAEQELRKELAIALYARGILPLGKARTLAQMELRAFLELLAKRGVIRHYTEQDLLDDIDAD